MAGVLAVLVSASGTAGAGAVEPHILDPAHDFVVAPFVVGVSEPSTDLISVTFSRDADDLVAVIEVLDLKFRPPEIKESYRVLSTYFRSDIHDHVMITAFEERVQWSVHVTCQIGHARTCNLWPEEPAEVDLENNTVTVRAPLDVVQGRVLQPHASSHVAFGKCGCELWSPNYGFQDYAPNTGHGQDYDPYE